LIRFECGDYTITHKVRRRLDRTVL
jgi:hypothetical protein